MQDIVVIREIPSSAHYILPLWKKERPGCGAREGLA
jgi:hypothetical protein